MGHGPSKLKGLQGPSIVYTCGVGHVTCHRLPVKFLPQSANCPPPPAPFFFLSPLAKLLYNSPEATELLVIVVDVAAWPVEAALLIIIVGLPSLGAVPGGILKVAWSQVNWSGLNGGGGAMALSSNLNSNSL